MNRCKMPFPGLYVRRSWEPKVETTQCKTECWWGKNENEAQLWLILYRLSQCLVRTTGKASMLACYCPLLGKRSKTVHMCKSQLVQVCVALGSQSWILQPINLWKRDCLWPSSTCKSKSVSPAATILPFQWSQRILRPQTPLVGYRWMWGGDWNCPLEQGWDWGWGGQPWTSEHPTDPLNKQQPLSLFSALEIAFKGLRKILLPIPTTPYIPCQLISHMPEHWLFWA